MVAGQNGRIRGALTLRGLLRWGLLWTLLASNMGIAADTPPSAQQVLTEAKAQAAEQHKNIFLIFGASWCGWCRKLEAFNGTPAVKAILAKKFVIAYLTVEEHAAKVSLDNPGGEELKVRLGGNSGDLPFFAFLDPAGNLLVNSNRPIPGKANDSNIGFPGTREEIDWFMAMLNKSALSLTQDDARLVESELRKQNLQGDPIPAEAKGFHPSAGPLTGTWECTAHLTDGDVPFTFNLQQDKQNVTGSASAEGGHGSPPITSGTFRENTLDLQLDQGKAGNFNGRLEKGELSGRCSMASDMGACTWKCRKQATESK